jgi:hypothetical protein
MKKVVWVLLISLWSCASWASDALELEKDRAALIATRLVFPKEGRPVNADMLVLPKTEVDKQIGKLKTCEKSQAFFAIYRHQLDLAVIGETINQLPLHIRCMPVAKRRFDRTRAHPKAINRSELFQLYKELYPF